MPYLSSLVDGAASGGDPVIASTGFYFPQDLQPFGMDPSFMLGPSLLVAPVVQQDATSRMVHLPAGAQWFDWYTGEAFTGGQTIVAPAPLDRIPLFVRGGAIVPTRVTDSVGSRLQIDLYAGALRQFTVYEPGADGSTFLRARATWYGGGGAQGFVVEPLAASMPAPMRGWTIALHEFTGPPAAVIADGVSISAAASPAAFDAQSSGWMYRASDGVLLVRFPGVSGGSTLFVQP
jgi:hypothetical protein